jgi:transposase
MDRYIGLDVHAASTTMAVVGPTGRRIRSQVVDTSAGPLVEALRGIGGERHVCLEEGTQSSWLYEVLEPHAAEVVVVCAFAQRGPKSDEKDAYWLAEQLRIGAVERRVFKGVGAFRQLRELSRVHTMVVRDVVRVQNRIRSVYRSCGVRTTDRVYSRKRREAWLEKLPQVQRLSVSRLYEQYDAVQPIRRQAEKAMVRESHRHPISEVLESCPGLGPIRVAQLLPVVVSPWRFRTKRQFWSYCGLGIVMRSSSDWVPKPGGGWQWAQQPQTRGLNRRHNRQLKSIFKGAATSVLMQHRSDALYELYRRTTQSGTKPNLAKLTLARKIAGIALSMWKSGQEYDPRQVIQAES